MVQDSAIATVTTPQAVLLVKMKKNMERTLSLMRKWMVIDTLNNVVTVTRWVLTHHGERYVLMTHLARLNSLYLPLMVDIILIHTLFGN
jgi:hypothetical protein